MIWIISIRNLWTINRFKSLHSVMYLELRIIRTLSRTRPLMTHRLLMRSPLFPQLDQSAELHRSLHWTTIFRLLPRYLLGLSERVSGDQVAPISITWMMVKTMMSHWACFDIQAGNPARPLCRASRRQGGVQYRCALLGTTLVNPFPTRHLDLALPCLPLPVRPRWIK